MKDDTYNELIEKAKLKKINVLYIKKGDTLSLGKTKIKCIYPETTTTASDKNDYCTVLSVKNKTSKILLTGDISKEIEEKIKDDIELHSPKSGTSRFKLFKLRKISEKSKSKVQHNICGEKQLIRTSWK